MATLCRMDGFLLFTFKNIISKSREAICLPNWGARPNLGATRPRVGIC